VKALAMVSLVVLQLPSQAALVLGVELLQEPEVVVWLQQAAAVKVLAMMSALVLPLILKAAFVLRFELLLGPQVVM
jgi:hypothetical protein